MWSTEESLTRNIKYSNERLQSTCLQSTRILYNVYCVCITTIVSRTDRFQMVEFARIFKQWMKNRRRKKNVERTTQRAALNQYSHIFVTKFETDGWHNVNVNKTRRKRKKKLHSVAKMRQNKTFISVWVGVILIHIDQFTSYNKNIFYFRNEKVRVRSMHSLAYTALHDNNACS